jgi:hypothetical protein
MLGTAAKRDAESLALQTPGEKMRLEWPVETIPAQ